MRFSRTRGSLRLVSLLALAGCAESRSDAVEITPDFDVRTLVHGVLAEYQREVEVSCPCRVARGDFSSETECVAKLGHDETFARCTADKLAQHDDPALRVALHCTMQQYGARATCAEAHDCETDALLACYDRVQTCPVLDPEALTHALTGCPGGSLLSR